MLRQLINSFSPKTRVASRHENHSLVEIHDVIVWRKRLSKHAELDNRIDLDEILAIQRATDKICLAEAVLESRGFNLSKEADHGCMGMGTGMTGRILNYLYRVDCDIYI